MTNFNCDIFCERVNSLFGSMGQMELSEKIGISQGVISAIKNKKVKAPGADTVFKIARHFNVSADWLLGMQGAPKTTDLTTKELCNALGLSEDAVWTLQMAKKLGSKDDLIKTRLIDMISLFFESDHSLPLFGALQFMQESARLYSEYIAKDKFDVLTEESEKECADMISLNESIDVNVFRATKELQAIADEMIEKVSNEKS